MSWLAWTFVVLAAAANAGAIGVLIVGARATTSAATRQFAYVCAMLAGLIVVLTVAAFVSLIPWDVVTGRTSTVATQEIVLLVTEMVNVTFGAIGFTILPGLGAIVLWSRARSLDKKASAPPQPVWPGAA